jgi:hypothetical protein
MAAEGETPQLLFFVRQHLEHPLSMARLGALVSPTALTSVKRRLPISRPRPPVRVYVNAVSLSYRFVSECPYRATC